VSRRNLAVDASIAVLTLGMSLGVLASHGLGVPDASARHLDATGVLLAVASTLPLVAWRLAPLAVYAVIGVASIALLELRYPLDFPFGCVAAAYFVSVACSGRARRRRLREDRDRARPAVLGPQLRRRVDRRRPDQTAPRADQRARGVCAAHRTRSRAGAPPRGRRGAHPDRPRAA
jgi:hypothetical protein